MADSRLGRGSPARAASSASAASMRSTTLFTLTCASVRAPRAFRPALIHHILDALLPMLKLSTLNARQLDDLHAAGAVRKQC